MAKYVGCKANEAPFLQGPQLLFSGTKRPNKGPKVRSVDLTRTLQSLYPVSLDVSG
jgi:hypothetical protein